MSNFMFPVCKNINCGNKNILYCYNGKKWYKNCRPVRKDEVTFYER